MIDSIYNYMTTTYTPKAVTRYDTHKPSELRKTYQRIVSKSSRSPLYKIRFSDSMQDKVIQMKDTALSLSNSLSSLDITDQNSVFHHKQADSSKPQQVAARLNSDDAADRSPFTIKVNQLATSQQNQSRPITDGDISPFEGYYSFSLEVNGTSKTFPIEVSSTSKNSEILSSISSSINAADMGVRSYLESNNSYVTLTIESAFTGRGTQEQTFRLTDQLKPDFQQGLLSYYDLSRPNILPQNASYEINGNSYESTQNELHINAYDLSLLDTTSNEVLIGLKTDGDQLLSGLISFKNTYNQLVSLSKSDNRAVFNRKLNNDLQTVSRHFRNLLESSGISFDSEGYMEVDEALALQSSDSGELQDLFSSSSDFTTRLRSRIASISLDPMDYVHKLLISYPNPKRSMIANPYMTSIYSGMLFNYYC